MNDESLKFWNGIKRVDGEPVDRNLFCHDLLRYVYQSPEMAKIFFNTQVYNEATNGTTTRGEHSLGVARVARALAVEKALKDGKSPEEAEISGMLAETIGYMHDLGHTPFGHDGEGALDSEMSRFEATDDYKDKRKALFGEEYTIGAGDAKASSMCYEHNETSSVIGTQLLKSFAAENGYIIEPEAIQYIKTGILAHSTSRVTEEPKGVEQKAVRVADKVAYIPQDLLDLVKQGVLKVEDLGPEELSLIGLNPDTLTKYEQAQLEECKSDEQKEAYLAALKERKLNLLSNLAQLDKLDEGTKEAIINKLDAQVAQVQETVAEKCFIGQELDGQKDIVDYFDMAVNDPDKLQKKLASGKYKIPEELADPVLQAKGKELFTILREAQKKGDEVAINSAAEAYKQFLANEVGMNPMMATLWVTKAKYQDSFIYGELKRTTEETRADGTTETKKETLAEINQREENSWKMKTLFQFFYSNMDRIPSEFIAKYQDEDKKLVYTEQQIVSAYIASFTNKGLTELYQKMVQEGLVLSREDAIEALKQLRPDLDIDQLTSDKTKIKDPNDPTKEYKVSANDMLEFLYESETGRTIVNGKNSPGREIPEIKAADAIRSEMGRSAPNLTPEQRDALLTSTIDVTKTVVTSEGVKEMAQSIAERHKEQEIEERVGEAKQEFENREADEGR